MIIRNTWARLTRKQMLVLYPFTLGLLNTLAFLAVYLSAEESISWSGFARASFDRFSYLRENVTLDAGSTSLTAAAIAAVLVVFLSASIRAPYFRAIVGLGYPVAPEGLYELLRLAGLYALTYAVVVLLPLSFSPEATAFAIVSGVVFALAVVFLFADYAVVFEGLSPVGAIRRSLGVLQKTLLVAVLIYVGASLAWLGIDALYAGYYEEGRNIFVLLPVSRLLLDAFVTVVVDTLLIFVYFDAQKS